MITMKGHVQDDLADGPLLPVPPWFPGAVHRLQEGPRGQANQDEDPATLSGKSG